MTAPLRVVAPCGCEYFLVDGEHWDVAVTPECRNPPHALWLWNHTLDDAAPIVRMGYLIAASEGRGPWAKLWPGRARG